MPREIRFRAWDEEQNYMLEPFTLTEIKSDNAGNSMIGQHYFNDLEIMQYTGLKDKQGREIFEGDIVRYKCISGSDAEEDYKESEDNKEYIGEVKFVNGAFCPRPDGSFPEDGYYAWRYWDFEIIGNIYSNPDLLK